MLLQFNDSFKSFSSWIALMTGVFLLAAIVIAAILGSFKNRQAQVSKAVSAYRQGEIAKTVYARTIAFNEALENFSELEQDTHPEFGTGRLYYDLGNTEFQLGEYPFAILYYSKAKNLMPREKAVARNLNLARNKLQAPNSRVITSPPKNIFIAPPPYISLPEYLQLFSCIALLGIALYSAWVWTRKSFFQNAAFFSFVLSGLLFIHLVLIRYLAPVEAVMVHAAELRRDAGFEFAKALDTPIPAGSIVIIQGISKDVNGDKSWVKITLPGGEFGFIPQDAVRKI